MAEKNTKVKEPAPLQFGIIGVGQGGSNIANEFARIGYKTIAINTSQTDLEKLDSIQETNRILASTGGLHGAGKNPDVGASAYKQNQEEILRTITDIFGNDMKAIFVCAGLGGGTGSGMAPLLAEDLAVGDMIVSMIVTLPSDDESPKAKMVALDAYSQISSNEKITSVFVLDNDINPVEGIVSVRNRYAAMNLSIVQKLDAVRNFTAMPSKEAFDQRDLMTLLSHRGTAAIMKIDIEDVEDLRRVEYLPVALTAALKTNIYANVEYNAALGYALIFNLPPGADSLLLSESSDRMRKTLGTPFDTYRGMYEKGEKGNKSGEAYILLTGLPVPKKRLGVIEEDISSVASAISEKMEERETGTYSSANGREMLNKFMKPKAGAQDKQSTESYVELMRKRF